MPSLLIELNMAANDMPISVASNVETEEEDLEKIQRDAAVAQQKIVDEAQAHLDMEKAWKEQKRLDQEKKAANDKAKKAKEVEEAQKAEDSWKAEAQKMEQAVSPEVMIQVRN